VGSVPENDWRQLTVDSIAGDWLSLEEKWNSVLNSETTLGSRSGGWHVRKEYSGDGLAPIAGDPDEIAIYIESGHRKQEVGRWKLSEVER